MHGNRTKGFIQNPLKNCLLCFSISSVLVRVLHVHKAILVHPFLHWGLSGIGQVKQLLVLN